MTWRGGENQVFRLANGLSQMSIPQTIICQPGSALESRALEAGLPVHTVRMRGEFDFFAVSELHQYIKKIPNPLLHVHTAWAHSLGLFVKKRLKDLPLVVSRRVDFKIQPNLFSRWKYRSKSNTVFLCVSHEIKRILISAGVSPEKCITVHSGIELGQYETLDAGNLREELGIDKKTIVLGNVAALVSHKDQDTLLRSLAKVQSETDFVLLILGEGKLETKLKSLTKELAIENKVKFLGFQENIRPYYGLFQIFLLTSNEEGLGTSLLDAMASGLPIIATRAGGIPELLQAPQGAILCEIANTNEISNAIENLLSNAKLRKSMGEYNKEMVKDFSYEATVQKTKLVYSSILGEALY